jgi:16S rRNA (guanine527-N7)-methyltransferase
LGPGDVDIALRRALDLAAGVDVPPARALDLGSGGGLPGLPLALAWPHSQWILLEASTTRAAFLADAVSKLAIGARVAVRAERAEVAGRSDLRGSIDLVVARGFGPPAVTAECAAPLIRVGGRLVVAEPPGGRPDRWDRAGLAILGMQVGASGTTPTAWQALVQAQPCPDRYPRRTGVAAKRPLF